MTRVQYTDLSAMPRDKLLFAIAVVWRMGRTRLISKPVSESNADIKTVFPTNVFTGEPVDRDDCSAARFVARLNPAELMGYIQHGCPELPDPNPDPNRDEDGVCPVCHAEYNIESEETDDSGCLQMWTCPNCGASGKAGYNKQFDRHYYVQNAAGQAIPGRPE